MFFILSKILHFLIQPLIWGLLMILIGFIWSKRVWIRNGLILLYLFSNAFLLLEVVRLYEPDINEKQLEYPFEIGIVLGGFSSYDAKNERIEFDMAADRLNHAIRLYKEKKIKKIMISGGSGRITVDTREAKIAADYLRALKIPERDILVESESKNTYENLVNTKALLKEKKVKGKLLLITSATHIPRSMAIAKKQGLDLTPFPVDHLAGDRMFSLDNLLVPQAEALSYWNVLLHEWIGFAVYKIKGYA